MDLLRRQAFQDTTLEVDAKATAAPDELVVAAPPTGTPSPTAKFNTVYNGGGGDPGAAPTPLMPEVSLSPTRAVTGDASNPTGTTVIQTNQGSSLPTGAIIGVAVAAGVALFAVIITGCVIWQRGKRRQRSRRAQAMEKMERMYDFVPGQAPPMRPAQSGPIIEMGRKPLSKKELERHPYPGMAQGRTTPTLSQASLATRELPPLPVERGTGDKWGPSFRQY